MGFAYCPSPCFHASWSTLLTLALGSRIYILKNLLSYYEKVENTLNKCGFLKEESASPDFKSAFTKRNLFTSLVFLIKTVDDDNFDVTTIKNLVASGREWCTRNVKACWIFKEAGLNIILLHKGQIDSKSLKEQVDTTGMHSSICQSITAIDIINNNVIQEKAWVVIGKVKKSLMRLKEIA